MYLRNLVKQFGIFQIPSIDNVDLVILWIIQLCFDLVLKVSIYFVFIFVKSNLHWKKYPLLSEADLAIHQKSPVIGSRYRLMRKWADKLTNLFPQSRIIFSKKDANLTDDLLQLWMSINKAAAAMITVRDVCLEKKIYLAQRGLEFGWSLTLQTEILIYHGRGEL